MIYRVYSNLIFWTAYGLSWLFWQIGGKQIRRGFLRSYDDIDEADAARTLEDTPLPDPQDDVVDLGEDDLFVIGSPEEHPFIRRHGSCVSSRITEEGDCEVQFDRRSDS